MYHIYFDTFDTDNNRFNYLIIDDSTVPIRFQWQPQLQHFFNATEWRTVTTFEHSEQVFTCATVDELLRVYTVHDNCVFTPVGTVVSLTDIPFSLPEHFI
mgnify:CR=1 FL=1